MPPSSAKAAKASAVRLGNARNPDTCGSTQPPRTSDRSRQGGTRIQQHPTLSNAATRLCRAGTTSATNQGLTFEPDIVARAGMRHWQYSRPLGAPCRNGVGDVLALSVGQMPSLCVVADDQRQFDPLHLIEQSLTPSGAHSLRGGRSPERPVPGKQKPMGRMAMHDAS